MPIYLKRVERNPRARSNMSFPKTITLPSGIVVQVDDMEELLALSGGAAVTASRPEVRVEVQRSTPRAAASTLFGAASAPQKEKGYTSFKPGLNNFRRIGVVLGNYRGISQLCPAIDSFASQKVESAVRSIGLTDENVGIAIEALKTAGIIKGNAYRRGQAAQADALAVLRQVVPIQCAIPNPGSRGRRFR